jgi:hypothetical protein
MQMIRQHHPAVNDERMIHTIVANDRSQQIDMAHEQVIVVAFEKIHREEIGAAFKPCASVIGHDGLCGVSLRCANEEIDDASTCGANPPVQARGQCALHSVIV